MGIYTECFSHLRAGSPLRAGRFCETSSQQATTMYVQFHNLLIWRDIVCLPAERCRPVRAGRRMSSDHGCLGTFFNNYRDTNDPVLVSMANSAFPEDEVWRVPSAAKGESRPS